MINQEIRKVLLEANKETKSQLQDIDMAAFNLRISAARLSNKEEAAVVEVVAEHLNSVVKELEEKLGKFEDLISQITDCRECKK
jgi:hypothetical protein